jgi:hypothetical protein
VEVTLSYPVYESSQLEQEKRIGWIYSNSDHGKFIVESVLEGNDYTILLLQKSRNILKFDS